MTLIPESEPSWEERVEHYLAALRERLLADARNLPEHIELPHDVKCPACEKEIQQTSVYVRTYTAPLCLTCGLSAYGLKVSGGAE